MITTLAKFSEIIGTKITAFFYTVYLVNKFGLKGAKKELARQELELRRRLFWLYQKQIGVLQCERDLLHLRHKELTRKMPKVELRALAIADLLKHSGLGIVSFQPRLGVKYDKDKVPVRDINFDLHYVDLADCSWPIGDEGENYWSTVNENRERD